MNYVAKAHFEAKDMSVELVFQIGIIYKMWYRINSYYIQNIFGKDIVMTWTSSENNDLETDMKICKYLYNL